MSGQTPTTDVPSSELRTVSVEVSGISPSRLHEVARRAELRVGQGCQFIFAEGSNVTIVVRNEMGDSAEIKGNVQGSVVGGSGSVNVQGDQVFGDLWKGAPDHIKDLSKLRDELSQLYKELAGKAESANERDSVAAVGKAIEAADSGNGPQVLQHLKTAGKWAFDIATKIGVAVAAAAAKVALGL